MISLSFKLITLFFVCLVAINTSTSQTDVDTSELPPNLFFTGNNQPKPGLGINLGPIDTGMSQWVFTNKFKHAREWRPVSTGNNWNTYNLAGTINTTWSSDGYPLEFFVPSWSNVGYLTSLGTNGLYPTGDYVLTFEGTGNISLYGDALNIQQTSANRFEFSVAQATSKGIEIVITKANVTNIDLREKIEENWANTFGQNFINAISRFSALRFSQWMINREGNTNPLANQNWSERRPSSFYTQIGKKIVSIEYIVELANVLKKDIWLSMPGEATYDYIENLAQFVKDHLESNTSTIYVEQSSDKGWMGNNRTLDMRVIDAWKSVFNTNETRSRLKFVLSTTSTYYFEQVMTVYSEEDLKKFDAYSVPGVIGHEIEYRRDDFNITQVAQLTVENVTEAIRQQIYKDEIQLIFQMHKVAIKLQRPLISYSVGFFVHAPGFSNRWKNTSVEAVNLEQRLEDLLIQAQRQQIFEDMFLDFMERWWKLGGGLMFATNLVERVNRCEKGGGRCGYLSLLESLLQNPESVPKYRALVKWLNGERGSLPFTSDDVPRRSLEGCTNCVWGTCYDGTCYCFDGYTGSSCNILSQKYLDCHSQSTEFGMNLEGIPDWSPEVTFLDLQRRARKWLVHKAVFQTAWAELNQEDIQLREDGYPKYLEIGKMIGTFLVRDVDARFPNGHYICLYDGDGTLEFWFNDHKIIRRDAGRIELMINHKTEMNNGVYYNIIRTNPSNPIRNVRFFEAKYEHIFEYFPFHPMYLELLKKYKTLRFMPWSNVNRDVDVAWENRTQNTDYTFNWRTGVSLEKQVLLCNTLGANPWFNLPHRATDDYIVNWATYLKNNLRPDVKIYIEVGNECWGLGGPHECGNYAQNMGTQLNMTIRERKNFYSRDLQARICYHAKVGSHYLNLIKQVFGEDIGRLKLVFAAQAAWRGPLEVFLLCEGNYSLDYNLVAIAPYLSGPMKDENNVLLSLDQIFNVSMPNAIQEAVFLLKNTFELLNSTAPWLQIATYESGPDFSSLTETANVELTKLSIKVHKDPRIYDALKAYLSNVTAAVPLKVYNHFTSTGKYSKYGCWGLLDSSDANLNESYKYKAYNEFIDAQKSCNWQEKDSVCQDNCNLKGTCVLNPLKNEKDICFCYFASKGDACEIFDYIKSERCTYQCGGKGSCLFNHTEGFYAIYTCHCDEGYYGYGCELFDCTNNCNYNGKCVDRNVCSCYNGYKGALCETDCGCNGHGVCSNTTNECICEQGYKFIAGSCKLDCTADDLRSECLSCPNCGFGTCIDGKCKCWAGYTLNSKKTCTVVTNSPNDGSKLGINLNGVPDWSTQWAFVDIGKQGREWIVQHIDKLNDLYIWSLNEKLNLTAERYPAEIPRERQAVTFFLRDVQRRWPDGIYHVFYDGEGEIEFGFDSKVIESNEKYKMTVKVTSTMIRDNGVFMKIKKTNPTNPLRNIRFVMNGFENIYQQMPFHPLFLERLAKFKTIRFMTWTAEKGVVAWNDRVKTTTFSQANGVAYEYQIQLCNILKVNCWLHVPYAADDFFIEQMARLVLANIRKDVKIYVELSNEGWNDFFESGKHFIKMGLQLGLSTDGHIAGNLYYSRRSRQMIQIWRNVFQAESNRIHWVVGSFSLLPQISTRILQFEDAYKAHNKIMLAITGYISCGDPSPQIVAISDASVIFSGCDADLPNLRNYIQAHATIARQFNVSLGMYESGSGMVEQEAIYSGFETKGATEKYIALNRDSRMFNVYKNYYRMFNQFNLSENCHFAYVALPSKYGSWHLLEYQNQSINQAHRYRAIMELIEEQREPIQTITPFYCQGKLFNESDVCQGRGICVSQDTCQYLFNLTISTADVQIVPTQGMALVDKFFLKTETWESTSYLMYAFGIQHPLSGPLRLTDYAQVPKAITILPYIGQSYKIVVFVKDDLNNEYTKASSLNVNVLRYNGTFNQQKTLVQTFDQNQKLIALIDKSNEQMVNELISEFELSGTNSVQNLESLETLSLNLKNQAPILETIGSTLTSFLNNFNVPLNENDALADIFTDSAISKTANIISNLIQSGSESTAESLIRKLTSVLLNNMGLLESTTTNESVSHFPSILFNTQSYEMVVSKIDLTTLPSANVNHGDVQFNAQAVFSGGNPLNQGGVSFVKYALEKTNSIVSNVIDIKFYYNGQVKPVKGLTSPLVLKFTIDDETISQTSSSLFELECRYLNEESGQWLTEGCIFDKLDAVQKVAYCNCTHTTSFTVFLEKVLADQGTATSGSLSYLNLQFNSTLLYLVVFFKSFLSDY